MQTSYSQDPVAGLPGQMASGYPDALITRVAEGTGCVPGRVVVSGTTAGDQAKAPAGAFTASSVLGIVHLDSQREAAAYDAGETLAIARNGEIWVEFEPDTAPVADTPVYVRHTANGAGKLVLGLVRADADTGAAVLTGAYFRKTVGTVAKIELSL